MSSISSISTTDSLALYLNQLNASETKVSDTAAANSTDVSSAVASANGVSSTDAVSASSESSASGSGTDSGSGSSNSQTTIERSVSRGEDGSMIITLTEVTTNSDGSTSSKVLSRMKMSSGTEGLLGSDNSSNSDNNYLNADSQMMLSKAQSSIQSNAGRQYEQNSIVGSYMAGVSLNLHG